LPARSSQAAVLPGQQSWLMPRGKLLMTSKGSLKKTEALSFCLENNTAAFSQNIFKADLNLYEHFRFNCNMLIFKTGLFKPV